MKQSLVRLGVSCFSLLLFAAVLSTTSCTKFPDPIAPGDTVVVKDPHHPGDTLISRDTIIIIDSLGGDRAPGKPMISGSAGIISARAIASLGNAGDFELDLYLSDADGKVITNIDPNSIDILAGLNAIVKPLGITHSTLPKLGPFSAEVLIDQTGSMQTSDPRNLRLDAARVFMSAISLFAPDPDEVQLSTFEDRMSYYGSLKSFGPFTRDGSSFNPVLSTLTYPDGGNTAVYDAIYQECDSLSRNAKNANKILIALTDGDDNASTHSMYEAIDHAKALGIKVFAIALKIGSYNMTTTPAETSFFTMAMATGGSSMQTNDPEQIVSYYSGLGNLAKGNVPYTTTKWHVEMPKGTTLKGTTLQGKLQIKTVSGSDIVAPFNVKF